MANCETIQRQLDDIAEVIYDMYYGNLFDLVGKCNVFLSDEAKDFNSIFSNLYNKSLSDNFFWQYCSLKTYESKYQQRLNNFLKLYPDGNEYDFIESEKEFFVGSKIERDLRPFRFYRFDFGVNINRNTKIDMDFLSDENLKRIKYTQEKKLHFLETKQNPMIDNNRESKAYQEPEIPLDYSNNSKAERIVFLHELGILDFLQKKMNNELHGFSINKLAEILSTFTDIEHKTIQPYINPIFSDGVNQRNNPVTPNNLKKVQEKLMKIGFNNIKTT